MTELEAVIDSGLMLFYIKKFYWLETDHSVCAWTRVIKYASFMHAFADNYYTGKGGKGEIVLCIFNTFITSFLRDVISKK